jgi:hypothetical protein
MKARNQIHSSYLVLMTFALFIVTQTLRGFLFGDPYKLFQGPAMQQAFFFMYAVEN